MKGFFCTWQHVLAFVCIVIHATFYFRVEKYRPQTLNDLISHQDILSTSKHPCVSCCHSSWRTCINFLVMSLLSNNLEVSDWALWNVVVKSWVPSDFSLLRLPLIWMWAWSAFEPTQGPRWMRQLLESDGLSLSSQSSVQKFISEDRLPHLLLYGPPGTGKTSTILACAKQLYKDKEFGSMVLEVSKRILLTLQRNRVS